MAHGTRGAVREDGRQGTHPLRTVTRHRLLSAALAALAFTAAGAACATGVATPAASPADRDTATVEPVPGQAALRVSGPVGWSFEADVREGLRRYPDTRVLVIDGPGGLRAQALRVAELANERGLAVRVAGRCASACALLWAAARHREMTWDSGLGLHGSALDPDLGLPENVRRRIIARNDRQTDDVLREAGFPARIIAAGAATPASSMTWFSAVELLGSGVPFAMVDGEGHAVAMDVRTGRVLGVAQVAPPRGD